MPDPEKHQGIWASVMIYWASTVPPTIYIYCARDMPHSCCCSVTQSCPTLCDPMDCSTPDFPVLHHLLELVQLMSIELVMPSKHLILCRSLLVLPSIFPRIRVLSNESPLSNESVAQSIGASASVLPMNIQGWFHFGLTGLTCLISFDTSNNPIKFKIQGPVVELGFQPRFFLL